MSNNFQIDLITFFSSNEAANGRVITVLYIFERVKNTARKMASVSMASSLNATAMSIGEEIATVQHLLASQAPGLQFLQETILQVYPNQINPLQVTAYIKYWLVYMQCSLYFIIKLI